MSTTTIPSDNFQKAECRRCKQTARLTRAGWRHGFPPHGDDGHCAGTVQFPDVAEH